MVERGVIRLHLPMATPLQRKRADASEAGNGTAIPDRLYFKIGDVAQICGVEAYVLRFWETQFPQLKPNKSGTGQRLYRRRDVEQALEIKQLVHGQGYTLQGARQALGKKPAPMTGQPSGIALVSGSENGQTSRVQRIRAELRAIAAMLGEPAGAAGEEVRMCAPLARPQRRRTRFATVASGELFPA